MLKTLTTAALAAFTVLAAPLGASAQGLLTLDTQRALLESAAATFVNEELAKHQTAMTDELKPFADAAESAAGPLAEEWNALRAETEDRSLVELSQDTDLQTRQLQLMEREQELAETPEIRDFLVRRQCLTAELVATRNKALIEIERVMGEIAEEIQGERSAVAVMERRALLLASDDIDITDTVISRLNERLPTPDMTRVEIDAEECQVA